MRRLLECLSDNVEALKRRVDELEEKERKPW
jgi:hypothetical protein